jgi:hypothetical protein
LTCPVFFSYDALSRCLDRSDPATRHILSGNPRRSRDRVCLVSALALAAFFSLESNNGFAGSNSRAVVGIISTIGGRKMGIIKNAAKKLKKTGKKLRPKKRRLPTLKKRR